MAIQWAQVLFSNKSALRPVGDSMPKHLCDAASIRLKMIPFKTPLTMQKQKFLSFAKCATKRKRCLLRWSTCVVRRNLKESDVCTVKNQRCGDSRARPEKHRLVTVQVQVRESQHQCSNCWWWPQRQRGRDELNRTLINENQRLGQTMNLNGCVLRCNALHMVPGTFLSGVTPVLLWLAARLLVS